MVEILYFDGCPNCFGLREHVRAVLDDAGIDAEIGLRLVRSEQEAEEVRFLGSPTVRVGGRDVEPGAEQRTDYGIKCRLYRTPGGISVLPSDQWIIAAVGGR